MPANDADLIVVISQKSCKRESGLASWNVKMPEVLQTGRLEVRTGFCSEQGRRPRNEDFGAAYTGTPDQRARLGVIAAVADGIGGAKGGRIAAELTVRCLFDAYLSQPETIGVRLAGARGVDSMNRWLHAIGRNDNTLEGLGCTLTALVLRGRQAHIIHIGDTRLYRLRDEHLACLTEDHTLSGAGRSHILTRAVGLGPALQIDYATEETRIHDRYLICSDGVHGVLGDRAIQKDLARRDDPDETARQIVAAALEAGSGDNVTAVVVDILSLPELNLGDLGILSSTLPVVPVPKSGTSMDGYRLGQILGDGRYSRVFRATEEKTAQEVVLKFPKPVIATDFLLRQAFLRESWIATRVRSPFIGESIDPAERRSCLYTVQYFYVGETLEQRLLRTPPIGFFAGLQIALNLSKAVSTLHRVGIIHRDIKPENLILLESGGLKLVDLGVARIPEMEDSPIYPVPGTASYIAPEMLAGGSGDDRTDQFALGVTLYRMFTCQYPYGEVEPFSHPRFKSPTPLSRERPDLPAWLDHAIVRTIAVRPEERFEDIQEFIFALEHGAERARPALIGHRPLYHRDPLKFWQIVSALLSIALAVALSRLAKA